MGSTCCANDGGAKVTAIPADAPTSEALGEQEAEAYCEDAFGAASHNEAYGLPGSSPKVLAKGLQEGVASAVAGASVEALAAQPPAATAAAATPPTSPSATAAATIPTGVVAAVEPLPGAGADAVASAVELVPAGGVARVEAAGSPKRSAITFVLMRQLEDNIGLNLDALDERAPFVDEVLAGAVLEWNAAHGEEKQLRVYDRIAEVNGIRGDTSAILAAMKQSNAWNVVIERPALLGLAVTLGEGQSLGLDLKYSPTGRSLFIADVIKDGAVCHWNHKRAMSEQVRARDRVMEINGKRGTSKELLEQATNKTSLELVVLHY